MNFNFNVNVEEINICLSLEKDIKQIILELENLKSDIYMRYYLTKNLIIDWVDADEMINKIDKIINVLKLKQEKINQIYQIEILK